MWLNQWASRSRFMRSVLLLVALTFVPLSTLHGGLSTPPTAYAATNLNWEYKGFNIAAYWKDELLQSGPALDQLVAAGANSVTFAVTWYTDSSFTSIYRKDNTATDESLIWAIQQARARGLKVIIKPHIDIDSNDRTWRAHIDPADINGWFAKYTAWMVNFADIAQQNNASVLTVGAELVTLSTNPNNQGRWRTLIATVRQHFSGKLIYSANWGGTEQYKEWAQIPFWDALDYIGISAYFPVADNNNSTQAQMIDKWRDAQQNQLLPFQQKWNKPIMFIEIGYRDMDGTAAAPFDWWSNNAPDPQEQVDAYEALFTSWANVSWFAGSQFWYWDLHPDTNPNVNDYPVQNKPAYDTVHTWFTAGGSTTPDPTTPDPTTPTPTDPTTTPPPGTAPVPPGLPPANLTYGIYLPMMNK